jgi:hypothetical protein
MSDLLARIQNRELADDQCGIAGTARLYSPTLRERLIAQKADLTQRLADVDNALTALDSNPNFESVLDVIGKVNY